MERSNRVMGMLWLYNTDVGPWSIGLFSGGPCRHWKTRRSGLRLSEAEEQARYIADAIQWE